jgi:hypothetical protein
MDVRMKNGNGTMVASVSIGFAGGVQSQKSCPEEVKDSPSGRGG